MEPLLGQIQPFGFNFAPRGWAKCDGQLLPIAQHSALFSLLGTTYGGDGRTTFALPDLRGRTALHFGQGPGLSSRAIGQQLGAYRLYEVRARVARAHGRTASQPHVGTQSRQVFDQEVVEIRIVSLLRWCRVLVHVAGVYSRPRPVTRRPHSHGQ